MTLCNMQAMTRSKIGILYGNTLRAWREYRELTQEQLAEQANTSGSVISLLESGKRQLSPKWMRTLGEILQVEPGYLLNKKPGELPMPLLDIWYRIPDNRREQALDVLKTFATEE